MGQEILGRPSKKTHKKCIKCREWKAKEGPDKRFGNHDTSTDGYQSICYDCKNVANRVAQVKNVAQRIRHHMSTRCMTQLGDCAPEGFVADMEEYLGYRIAKLVKHLRTDLALREPDKKLRTALEEGYHIDHLKPLSLFPVIFTDRGGEKQVNWDIFKECWDIENLSAIPAAENLAKGAKYAETEADLIIFDDYTDQDDQTDQED